MNCLHFYDVVLLDLSFHAFSQKPDGLELLPEVRKAQSDAEIIVYSSLDDLQTIATVRSLGANNFLSKNKCSYEAVIVKVGEALRRRASRRETIEQGRELAESVGAVFVSQAMRDVFVQAALARRNERAHVLIQGPTGSGKELIASAIGNVKGRPFVAINCANIAENLIESELFGHERGSFTGADRSSSGVFSAANGGTLFLDEVGCLSKRAQEGLLRVLQNGEFKRLGSSATQRVKVRVVAATNDPLDEMAKGGTFRTDLLERLGSVRIAVPPLNARRADIEPLIRHFLAKHGRKELAIEASCLAFLCDYSWPRNVRQLENVVGNMVSRVTGTELEVGDLPEEFIAEVADQSAAQTAPSPAPAVMRAGATFVEIPDGTSLDDAHLIVTRNMLIRACERVGEKTSVRAIADELKVERGVIGRRLKDLGLNSLQDLFPAQSSAEASPQ